MLTLAENTWRQFWLGKTLDATVDASKTETLYMFILWVNIISFVLLMAAMLWFMFKYSRGKQKENYQVSASHNTPLELAWSIIPLIVMIPIFWYGFTGYVSKMAAPANAEEIMVRGYQWNWDITYKTGGTPQPTDDRWKPAKITKSGKEVPVFAVPMGRPVRLVMTSSDVIHAFYIPDFRLKLDVIPNRYTSMSFTANKPGEHVVYCAEYCGQDHSEMAAKLIVIPVDEYEPLIKRWTEPPDNMPLVKIGELIAKQRCASCHSVDGSPGTGPTWKGLYKKTESWTDGTSGTADENYIRESILVPGAKVVKGYQNNMPSFQGQLKPKQLDALVLYIMSLSDKVSEEEKKKGEQTPADLKKAESKS